jgi:hypothetical protein
MAVYPFMFHIFQIVFFIGIFLAATRFLIPKSASFYAQWKRSGESKHISSAASCLSVAIFFLAANLVMFLKVFIS